MIQRIETAYWRLPFQFFGDAGRGGSGVEELVTTRVHGYGLVGHGYAYTLGQGEGTRYRVQGPEQGGQTNGKADR